MNQDNHNKEVDQHSGVETTGHEWDGIKELNNPAPRWWLWVFYLTCIWAVGYWIVYPAWPTLSGEGERGGTRGTFEWTQYKKLKEEQAEIIERKSAYLERFRNSSFEEIMNDPELYNFAVAGGKTSFKDNCATCHGTGGAGAKGYPNLNDDDWLWGGSPQDIYQTIKYGIRATHDDSRYSLMPAFGEMLSSKEVNAVAGYVHDMSLGKAELLTGAETEAQMATLPDGMRLYKEHCAACHGVTGKGDRTMGAPNLSDALWFYSEGDKASIAAQIAKPKHGMMPNWNGRLDDETIRQLTIFVHSLGGGE
ncbi:MAG: cytochrome-c oxidase, cbb3-type subunit III [Rickettsiales bacterium]